MIQASTCNECKGSGKSYRQGLYVKCLESCTCERCNGRGWTVIMSWMIPYKELHEFIEAETKRRAKEPQS